MLNSPILGAVQGHAVHHSSVVRYKQRQRLETGCGASSGTVVAQYTVALLFGIELHMQQSQGQCYCLSWLQMHDRVTTVRTTFRYLVRLTAFVTGMVVWQVRYTEPRHALVIGNRYQGTLRVMSSL